jgi:serine protease Do
MFSGIGLAIPINMAVAVVHDLLDTGKVERGFLGIQMDPVDSSTADALGLKDERGVTVNKVVDNSPAAKAGFEGGDVILTADGQKVEDVSKLRLLVSLHHPGAELHFGVVRFNVDSKKPEHKELVARLASMPARFVLVASRILWIGARSKGHYGCVCWALRGRRV